MSINIGDIVVLLTDDNDDLVAYPITKDVAVGDNVILCQTYDKKLAPFNVCTPEINGNVLNVLTQDKKIAAVQTCSDGWFSTRCLDVFHSKKVVQTSNYVYSINSLDNTCCLVSFKLNDFNEQIFTIKWEKTSQFVQSINGLVAVGDNAFFCGNFSYVNSDSNVKKYDPLTGLTSGVGVLQDSCIDICKNSSDEIFVLCYNTGGLCIKKLTTNNNWLTVAQLQNYPSNMNMTTNDVIFVTLRISDSLCEVYSFNTITNTLTQLQSISDSENTIIDCCVNSIMRNNNVEIYAIKNFLTYSGSNYISNWNLLKLDNSNWVKLGEDKPLHNGAVNCFKTYYDGRLIVGGEFIELESSVIDIAEIFVDENGIPTYSSIGKSKIKSFNCNSGSSSILNCCKWDNVSNFIYDGYLSINCGINDVFVNINNSLLASSGKEINTQYGNTAFSIFTIPYLGMLNYGVASYPYPIVTFNQEGC